VMLATSGSLLSFACAPGTTASDGSGRNGLFTKHLLEYIITPNEDIQLLLRDVANGVREESNGKQVPWQNSSLTQRNIFLYSTDQSSNHSLIKGITKQLTNMNVDGSTHRQINTINYDDGGKYEGDVNEQGEEDGQGIYWWGKVEFEGDRYEGEWKGGRRDGCGVYYYGLGKDCIKYEVTMEIGLKGK
ncbi:unnamed protein product, partial [Didymodactylos carnosus]